MRITTARLWPASDSQDTAQSLAACERRAIMTDPDPDLDPDEESRQVKTEHIQSAQSLAADVGLIIR